MSRQDEQSPIRERWTAMPLGSGEEAMAGALLRAATSFSIGEKKLAEIHARVRRSQHRRSPRPSPAWRLTVRLAFAAVIAGFGGVLYAAVTRFVIHSPNRADEQRESGASTKRIRRPPGSPRAVLRPEGRTPELPALAPANDLAAEETDKNNTPGPEPAKRPASPNRIVPSSRRLAARDTSSEAPPIGRSGFEESAAQATREPVSEPAPLAPLAPTPAPALPWPSASAPGREPTPALTPAPSRPSEASALARESRLLASAIAKLRQNREPEQALRILDQYQAEFAAGALAPEAAATRVETLLQLGRQGEALILLDAQPLTARWMGREMLVARAELRATRGRYSAAFADFEEALRTSQHPDSLKERSLYGRAICLSNRGDMQGARRSFERYLVEFPNGRFAEQARTAIQKLR